MSPDRLDPSRLVRDFGAMLWQPRVMHVLPVYLLPVAYVARVLCAIGAI
jgi:hypothetical protein